MLAKADAAMNQKSLTGYPKLIHDFATLLENHMHAIPEDMWFSFQSDCLNLVQNYSQGSQQQQYMAWQQSPAWQPPHQQQLWQPMPPGPVVLQSSPTRHSLHVSRQQTSPAHFGSGFSSMPFKTPTPTRMEPSLPSTPTGFAGNIMEGLTDLNVDSNAKSGGRVSVSKE